MSNTCESLAMAFCLKSGSSEATSVQHRAASPSQTHSTIILMAEDELIKPKHQYTAVVYLLVKLPSSNTPKVFRNLITKVRIR